MHTSRLSQSIPVTSRTYCWDELAKEAAWASQNHLCHVYFAVNPQGGFTSIPQKLTETRESKILPSQQQNTSEMAPTMYLPGCEMQVAALEFCKQHGLKINKLKGGYTSTANLLFQPWLKDIKTQVEDWNLTQREALQLIIYFTAKCACDIEFYIDMVMEDHQYLKTS